MMRIMGLLVLVLCAFSAKAATMSDAERLYDEGSYRLAQEAYAKIDTAALPPGEKRWIEFRLAETQARSEASTDQPDDSLLRTAVAELQKLVRPDTPEDRVWAEAQETLGDLQRGFRRNFNLGGAWPYYEKALDYWAGSTNLTLAAAKYWGIVRKAAEPPVVEPFWYYGSYGTSIPLNVLENALKIARNDQEKARAHFMIAMTLRSQGGEWEQRFRIPFEFEAALELKKDSGWYDDALYFYADWMRSNGRAVQDQEGNWRMEPDYEKALSLFRRLTSEFRKGQTPWFDEAQRAAQEIARADVDVSVSEVFLPGSEIEFHLSCRNVEEVTFTLYAVDLTSDLRLEEGDGDWLKGFSTSRARKVRSWKKAIEKGGPYAPTSENIRLEEKLGTGAYVLVAEGGKATDRELLLISNAAAVVQTLGRQAIIYACDSSSGAPLGASTVTLWERYYERSSWYWKRQQKEADDQGLARFELRGGDTQSTLFASIKSGDRQAFVQTGSYRAGYNVDAWKIYAFANKPAFRPGEKVSWKIVARRRAQDSYTTPAGEKILLRIIDPRGTEVKKETLELNSFGSAWGNLDLKDDWTLGEYQAVFIKPDQSGEIGRATLFRLEEYKLPEFKVSVQTPEENGRKKTFLLGEPVEVEIAADYYFGGPVANATAEVVVYQSPYYRLWKEPRPYPWFFEEPSASYRRFGEGQVVQRETLTTDEKGKARLTIKTPLGAGSDLEYRVEARVTDASRREIRGSDTVRVGRQRFYVHPSPQHKLYQPQDKVDVSFKTEDINEQPVAATGQVRVTREFWFEIWLAPDGHEVKGEELEKLKRENAFPPAPAAGQKPWRLKFRGYQQDEILTRTLHADTNGVATLSFTPEREGYYKIAWQTEEKFKDGQIPGRPIRAETAVWVATTRSAEIGYRTGGLEIIVDKDSFRAGQKAAVMLSVPDNDRYVLFSTSGNELFDTKLIHLTGSVKFLEIEVTEQHVPNFFLNADMVSGQQLFTAQQEVVVPPVRNFLTVEVQPDKAEYQPGEKGTLVVRARDNDGKPVSAEVALTVFDDSVSYIQQDYAGDPRQFFFGAKRNAMLSVSSSFNYRPYRQLYPKDEESLVGREPKELGRFDSADTYSLAYKVGGRAGLQGGTAPALRQKAEAVPNSLADVGSILGNRADLGVAFAAAPAAEAASASNASEPVVQVRTDFRSSIFWQPDLRTDQNGRAEVSFTYPDSLTTWKAVARAVTSGNQFGSDDETTRTKQPLIVRLQAPRFFLEGDTVTVSAVINNNTEQELTVSTELVSSGVDADPEKPMVRVPAGGEERVDWVVHPRHPGEARLKVIGRAGRYTDAMEKTFPVFEHGIEKFLAVSGKSLSSEVNAVLSLPSARKVGSTHLAVQVTPSLAVTMLDALPYLVDYPYGCTEQTMSRFLPAVITAKTLKDLVLQPEDVMNRVFGGIEEGSASKTHPGGRKNLEKLDEITKKGLTRLYDFQHADGGWGWWKEGESDRYMTAYVVWGLALAKAAGTQVDEGALERAVKFLNLALVEAERAYDMQAFMLQALAATSSAMTPEEDTAFANLWAHRDELNAYTRALFALAAHNFHKKSEAQILIRNLANGVKRDEAPGQSVLAPGASTSPSGMATAHWGSEGVYWRWSEGGVEATAFALRALLAIDPENELVDPVANWLIKNRRGAQWSNTRDTAIVLLALNDYLRVSGEVKGELEYELFVNGESLGTRKVSGPDVFAAPEKIEVPEKLVRDGRNEIRIVRKSGEAPIYFAAQATFFSLEEPIKAAGNEIFVRRRYYKLSPVPTLLKGYEYAKTELASGETVNTGDRLETVITIEAKNNYEYLLFEDLKPAGVEAVEIRSGELLYAHRLRAASVDSQKSATKPASTEPIVQNDHSKDETGETRWVYQELRDRKVALFLDKLPEGFWEIRYETIAEVPGVFHALPMLGHAMYVPEIRANSAESILAVKDGE